MLGWAVADDRETFDAEYARSGLHDDYAMQADLIVLMLATTRLALNFGLRHVFRVRRGEAAVEDILARSRPTQLGEIVDAATARELLVWACKVDGVVHRPPDFVVSDALAKTYVTITAEVLLYSVGPFSNWRKRYRAISRVFRRRFRVREAIRAHPEAQPLAPSRETQQTRKSRRQP